MALATSHSPTASTAFGISRPSSAALIAREAQSGLGRLEQRKFPDPPFDPTA